MGYPRSPKSLRWGLRSRGSDQVGTQGLTDPHTPGDLRGFHWAHRSEGRCGRRAESRGQVVVGATWTWGPQGSRSSRVTGWDSVAI